jgi:hypothetical protein
VILTEVENVIVFIMEEKLVANLNIADTATVIAGCLLQQRLLRDDK